MTADLTTESTNESGSPSDAETDSSTHSEAAASRSLRELFARVESWLVSLRADDTRRRLALVGALIVGLVFAWVHWVGLVVAGALVGLTRRRLRWAVTAGVMVGVVVVIMTPVISSTVSVGMFLALEPVNYVTMSVALILPAWGALIRYVV